MSVVALKCIDGHDVTWDTNNTFPQGCKTVISWDDGEGNQIYCNKRVGRVDEAEDYTTYPPEESGVGFNISDIVSPDAETTTNDRGGMQSHVPVRFDLIDGKAMFAMAAVLHEGAEKYAPGNWRLIATRDHLNHALMHIYAYLSGDRTDDHLSHALCRITFANAVELDPEAGPERDE